MALLSVLAFWNIHVPHAHFTAPFLSCIPCIFGCLCSSSFISFILVSSVVVFACLSHPFLYFPFLLPNPNGKKNPVHFIKYSGNANHLRCHIFRLYGEGAIIKFIFNSMRNALGVHEWDLLLGFVSFLPPSFLVHSLDTICCVACICCVENFISVRLLLIMLQVNDTALLNSHLCLAQGMEKGRRIYKYASI